MHPLSLSLDYAYLVLIYGLPLFFKGALASLGIPFVDVLRILVAILLLGNVEFVDGEGLELDVKGNNGRCNNFKY